MSKHQPDSASVPEIYRSETVTIGLDSMTQPGDRVSFDRLSRSSVPTFLPGERAVGRFRIVRLVGQGGMGQVFEAFDEELEAKVALKVIRPEIAGSRRVMELFKQEIQLARKVTHPNVCRIFDLFLEEAAKTNWGRAGEQTRFLTMEFLEGEELGRRLEKAEAPTLLEARNWTEQLVGGLAAMHRAGITHRDLKPENILLVFRDQDLRPVITDFGLAIGSWKSGTESSSPTAGTPAYSAPEQKDGKALTPAADIYSFGLILLKLMEAVEGAPSDRRAQAPESLEERVGRLKSPWSKVLRTCLQKEPLSRYEDAGRLSSALFPSRVWPHRAFWAVGASGLLLAGMLTFMERGRDANTQLSRTATTVEPILEEAVILAPRPTLAILPFSTSEMGDEGLADLLSEGLRIAFQARLDLRLLRDPTSGTAYRNLAPEILGPLAELTLVGTLHREPHDGPPTVRWILSRPGEPETEARGALELEEPFSPVAIESLARAIHATLEELGLSPSPHGEDSFHQSLSGLPETGENLRALIDARGALSASNPRKALDLLRPAEISEPDSWEIATTQAQAWSLLGFDRRAAATAARAAQLSREAPREVRNRLEAEHWIREGNWAAAINMYRSLWARYPDDLGYGLALGEASWLGTGVDAAAEVLEQLETLPANAFERLLTHLLQARLAKQRGEWEFLTSLARETSREALSLGASQEALLSFFLEAEAIWTAEEQENLADIQQRFAKAASERRWTQIELADTLLKIRESGPLSEALRLDLSLEDAELLFEKAGRLRDQARIQALIARRGRLTPGSRIEALELAQRSVANAQRAESPRAQAEAHNVVALLHHLQGDTVPAEEHFGSAVEAAYEVGEVVLLGGALHNHALILQRLGRLRRSQDRYEEAGKLFRASGEKRGWVMTLLNSGSLLAELGDLPKAQSKLEEALLFAADLPSPGFLCMATERLADVLDLRGRTEEADRNFARALELWEETESSAGGRIRLLLAVRKGAEGGFENAKAAEEEIRWILGRDSSQGAAFGQILAKAYLARVLLLQNRVDEAAIALEFEESEQGYLQDRALAFELARSRARLESARGRTDAAIQTIQAQLEQVEAHGSIRYQLNLRLLLGEVLHKGGRPEAAASQLKSALRQAEELGFVRVAEESTRLLAGLPAGHS